LDAFNSRIKPLLVCFKPEIRDKILTTMVRKNKKMERTPLNIFTYKDCEMSSGIPYDEEKQDTLEELMAMEDKEIEFWLRVEERPMFEKELNINWEQIQLDYHERKRIERLEGIKHEKLKVIELSKRLEVKELANIKKNLKLTKTLDSYIEFDKDIDPITGEETLVLKSKKWEVKLFPYTILTKYEGWAENRMKYYQMNIGDKKMMTYEKWLKYEYDLAEDEIKKEKIQKELTLAGVK